MLVGVYCVLHNQTCLILINLAHRHWDSFGSPNKLVPSYVAGENLAGFGFDRRSAAIKIPKTVTSTIVMFICLAAGRGERMRPLTNYLHKAMIPFDGAPFLAHSLLSIPEGSEIVIIVNYLNEQIVNYFGSDYKGRKIQYLKQNDPKGTGDALFQFGQTYQPITPVIVWQADQMIFPGEVAILSKSKPNASICSNTGQDMGFWKIKPGSLGSMRNCLEHDEYRALPALEREGLNRIKVHREKLEISFDDWEKIEKQCKLFRQKFPAGFR